MGTRAVACEGRRAIVLPTMPDVGLEAMQVLPGGEMHSSTESELFSERLGHLLRRGDLLSSRGTIVKSNEQLLPDVSYDDLDAETNHSQFFYRLRQ